MGAPLVLAGGLKLNRKQFVAFVWRRHFPFPRKVLIDS
jgi:hypothetical protein